MFRARQLGLLHCILDADFCYFCSVLGVTRVSLVSGGEFISLGSCTSHSSLVVAHKLAFLLIFGGSGEHYVAADPSTKTVSVSVAQKLHVVSVVLRHNDKRCCLLFEARKVSTAFCRNFAFCTPTTCSTAWVAGGKPLVTVEERSSRLGKTMCVFALKTNVLAAAETVNRCKVNFEISVYAVRGYRVKIAGECGVRR